jgi:hypothetical protein
MAIRHTIQKAVEANARLYGSTWDENGPQGTNTVTTGMFDSTRHYAFFRFGGIDIPSYASVISAQFKFYVSGGNSNSGHAHTVSGVQDNGTLWTESARNGAGRDTTATNSVYLSDKTGKWYYANIKAIAEAWRDGDMDATRGICITCATSGSYKIIDGRFRPKAPTLTIVYEIPASVPVPNASTLELGNELTVNLTGVEDGVTHEVRYKIGENTLYTDDEIGSGTVSVYEVPTSAGQYFPTSATGVLTVEVETYDAGEVSRGTVTASVTLTLPSDNAPTLEVDEDYPAIAWVDGVDEAAKIDAFVQGTGGARVKLTGTPMYGATIASYAVTCEGKAYSGADVIHKPFAGSGTVKAHCTVTDSRSVVSPALEVPMTVLAWQQPQIETFSVQRVNASGSPEIDGTRIKATIKATASSLVVGTEQNALKYKVAYREAVAAGATPNAWSYSDVVTVGARTADDGYVLESDNEEITTFDDMKGYDFQLVIWDIYAQSTKDTAIATSEIVIDINTDDIGVAIGGESTGEKFEVYKPAHFYGGIPQLDYSTTAVDTGIKWIDGETIYRKVLTFDAVSTGGTATISTGESAIDTLITLRGAGNSGTAGQVLPLPFAHYSTVGNNRDLTISSKTSNPSVVVRCGSTANLPDGGHIIIEYTLPD